MMVDQPFAELLMQFRVQAGMTQSRLAEKSNLDHSYVSRLESGHRMPSREVVVLFADAMGLSSEEYDCLLASAGFMPIQVGNLLQDEPVVSDLWQLLQDPAISSEIKDVVRNLIGGQLVLARIATIVPHIGGERSHLEIVAG